jgi:hypothetical protein
LHKGSDIIPEYVEYVYNVYIINIIVIIIITALRQYMTVYIHIYIFIFIHDTEICVTDGLASLSFAGLARCESGPENRPVCRGCCFFLWWMNFLGPETSLSYLSYLSLSSLDITENE